MNKFFNKILAKKAVRGRGFIIIMNILGFLLLSPFIFFSNVFSSSKSPKKIAIMRPDNIGDLVMITPMFKPIKNTFPDAELSILCQTSTKKLLEADDSIIISEFNPFWLTRSNHSIKETLKYIYKNFRKYDLLFEVRGDPFCEAISFFIAKKRIGFYDWGGAFFLNKSQGWSDNKHRIENNLKLLSEIMPEEKYLESDQNLTLVKSDYVDSFFDGIQDSEKIILHPYAGQKQRDFPDVLIKGIIEKYRDKSAQIFITGSSGDYEKVANFMKKFEIDQKNVLNVCGKFDLQQLPYFVKKCDLVICPDTSMAHIAAAFKKPQVCLYGQKKQKTFYPYNNPNAIVLLKEENCEFMKKGRCTNSNCEIHMKGFNVQEVFEGIQEAYNKNG